MDVQSAGDDHALVHVALCRAPSLPWKKDVTRPAGLSATTGADCINPSLCHRDGPFHEPLFQAPHTCPSADSQSTVWVPSVVITADGAEAMRLCVLTRGVSSTGPLHEPAYEALIR